ncbi:MAG: GGDEF domain-containing protein [Archangiaceae bacterium]|nr:GGDEF domain-containing protein [Archangiaceae bacterium]
MSTRDEAIGSVLRRVGSSRQLAAGEVLHVAGASLAFAALVVRGELALALDVAGAETLEHWSAGDLVHLAAFITREPTEGFVVALVASEVCVVDAAAFEALLRTDAEFARRVLELVARQATSLEQRAWRHARSERLFDPLTNAQTRQWLSQALPRLVARHEQEHEPLCALLLDLDRFMHFNDEFGFQAGDDALRLVAQTVWRSMRVNDRLVRVGGEEFVVLLPSTTLEEAAQAAERVRASVAATPVRTLRAVTVSIGVAEHHRGAEPEALIERARVAKFDAKLGGRNRVAVSPTALR